MNLTNFMLRGREGWGASMGGYRSGGRSNDRRRRAWRCIGHSWISLDGATITGTLGQVKRIAVGRAANGAAPKDEGAAAVHIRSEVVPFAEPVGE